MAVKKKLVARNIVIAFLSDIFGKESGNTYEQGLVDPSNEDNFKNSRESVQASCPL